MNFQRKKRASVDINLIPMIDVLLVLLIFFVLTTTFSKYTQLKINLPEAQSATNEQPETEEKIISVLVNPKGEYALLDDAGKPQPLADQKPATLKSALEQLAGDTRSLPFIINADGKAPHQAVITVLDVAQQLGFSKITFAASSAEAEQSP
jgi:biopolymer transport protein ExbD